MFSYARVLQTNTLTYDLRFNFFLAFTLNVDIIGKKLFMNSFGWSFYGRARLLNFKLRD